MTRPGRPVEEVHPETEGIDLSTETTPAEATPSSRLTRSLLRAVRPRQWPKNVLVFAAPGAAGVLDEAGMAGRAALAFVAFCLAASATYLLNDLSDRDADRRHPVKRLRPIASGAVSGSTAAVAAGVLLVAAIAVAAAVNWPLAGVIAFYVTLTTAYTLWLKHIAVVDIAVVASGFVIRAVAGGVAVDVPISQWFLIVASFGSLFMVAGKRHGEHVMLGDERAAVRATLDDYSDTYLRYVWMLASAVTITAYCLWAFERSAGSGFPWYELSIVPFVLAILRYALLLEAGHGSAPEELVLDDRALQVLGVAWVAVFALGVYTH